MISLLIFVFQLSLFTLLALVLHYYSPRIGLAPLLFAIGGIIGLLNIIELNSLSIALEFGYNLRPAAHVFVPVSLMIILVLYVVHGTRSAQIAVIGIIGIDALVLITFLFLLAYVNFSSPDTIITGAFADDTVFNLFFTRSMVASIVAYTADMLILIIVYQGIYNHLKWIPKLLIPGIAIVVALWTDSVLFNIGAFLGTELFSLRIPSDVVVKTFVGIWIAPFAGWYLTQIAPESPDFLGADNRETFAILFRHRHRDKQLETLENELRVSRSVYNQLTQHIEEIFWLIDIDQRQILYVSPAYERITGYSVESLYKDFNNVMQIFHSQGRVIPQKVILRFLSSRQNIEFQIIRPNKVVRWMRARAFPVEDEQGNIIRYAGVAEDITERKKLTEQDFELAVTRERMKILHEFISDASHDLKTPLSSMMLKLGLLEKVEDENRRSELRQELRERASHLAELITDLFTLSRIEGHDVIEVQSINLNEIVETVVLDTAILAEEKNLNLSTDLSQDNLTFEGNAEQMNRVISNFMTNAIRYTSEGSIRIQTWLEDDKVCVNVQDTGIGIPADSLDKVFDRFYRTTEARDTQEGTGLGLAIAKAIADRHHGEIMVDSIQSKGSTFTLKIPKTHDKIVSMTDSRRKTQEIRVLPPNF